MLALLDYWLNRLRWIPILVIFAAIMQGTLWATDREPPFHVIRSTTFPPSVPGGVLRLEGDVYRDISRNCYVRVIHWIEDSTGFRYFLPTIGLTHESIKSAEASNPGKTRYVVDIDSTVSIGKANYHAENAYVCNPFHMVWPVVVVTDIPFEVTNE